MKQLKAIHDLFRFEDDLFWNKAEIFRNEACTGIGQNTFLPKSLKAYRPSLSSNKVLKYIKNYLFTPVF